MNPYWPPNVKGASWKLIVNFAFYPDEKGLVHFIDRYRRFGRDNFARLPGFGSKTMKALDQVMDFENKRRLAPSDKSD